MRDANGCCVPAHPVWGRGGHTDAVLRDQSIWRPTSHAPLLLWRVVSANSITGSLWAALPNLSRLLTTSTTLTLVHRLQTNVKQHIQCWL
jgi:hypothetical protein